MNKFVIALASGAAMTAIAVPAQAQVANTFTGARVEGLLGYDIAKPDGESVDGLLYGVGVGYDIDLGGAVAGIEGEFTDSTGKKNYTNNLDVNDFGIGRVKTGRDLYIGGRVGVKVRPDLLAYAKGGYTNGKFELRSTLGEFFRDENIHADGFRIGAGLEYALNQNSFTKLEYRYSNYSKAEIDFDNGPDSDRYDVDLDRHQIVASYGIRF
ncbi:outer membrane beta-barrel protein [Croceicoccus sp. F390]|uniref:Outer membrane beta-barrel protein n=1 Tax=Croceicoccus esteveae TaxID=3075597 RepID=A0ABU2ZEN0_9SPHN|nr:outer membrane beta-barrel protein [Croceicoccus sp. F390]MDT0574845.1 outer membrane beta-barrel protein [Croceicoccus sp. F390]